MSNTGRLRAAETSVRSRRARVGSTSDCASSEPEPTGVAA
jgi:hypothetical protein